MVQLWTLVLSRTSIDASASTVIYPAFRIREVIGPKCFLDQLRLREAWKESLTRASGARRGMSHSIAIRYSIVKSQKQSSVGGSRSLQTTTGIFIVGPRLASFVLHLLLSCLFVSSAFPQSLPPKLPMPRQLPPGFVGGVRCRDCHPNQYRSYQTSAMANSLFRPTPSNAPEFKATSRLLFHAKSEFHYEMIERQGRFYQKRFLVDALGKPTRVREEEITYVVGSGGHARTYLTTSLRRPDYRAAGVMVPAKEGLGYVARIQLQETTGLLARGEPRVHVLS